MTENEISYAIIGIAMELHKNIGAGLLESAYENALVYDKDKSLNEPRFPDELVRHKILDVIGDLALCGFRIKGHVIASQSAHSLNAELAKQLQEEYWRKS